jgi:pyruvate kinase
MVAIADFLRQRRQVDRLAGADQPPLLGARRVEQVEHQPLQPLAFLDDQADRLSIGRRVGGAERAALDQLGACDQRGERRLEIVRGGREKVLLEIATAGRMARPVITATQMLDSMVASSRPTRAEVADVANAILDGTDAVMLSQETAVGAYAVEAVEMMASIAERAEQTAPYEHWVENRVRRDERDPAYTIAFMACRAAEELSLAALVVPTLSGRSARLISAHRPRVPILALSPGRETVRRCGLMWGVQASSLPRYEVTEELIGAAARRVVELGWVERGQRIGVTAGLPSGRPGTTSLVQVQQV